MNTIQILFYKLRDIFQLVRQLFGYVATFLWALLRSKAALSARLVAAESPLAVCAQHMKLKKQPVPTENSVRILT